MHRLVAEVVVHLSGDGLPVPPESSVGPWAREDPGVKPVSGPTFYEALTEPDVVPKVAKGQIHRSDIRQRIEVLAARARPNPKLPARKDETCDVLVHAGEQFPVLNMDNRVQVREAATLLAIVMLCQLLPIQAEGTERGGEAVAFRQTLGRTTFPGVAEKVCMVIHSSKFGS